MTLNTTRSCPIARDNANNPFPPYPESASTMMLYDIVELQRNYGANTDYNSGTITTISIRPPNSIRKRSGMAAELIRSISPTIPQTSRSIFVKEPGQRGMVYSRVCASPTTQYRKCSWRIRKRYAARQRSCQLADRQCRKRYASWWR